jgi:hypothetical protein
LAGIGAAETRSQYALSAIFFKLLRGKSLAGVRIKGALAFVTPILLHGGIPRSCFGEFYEKVVKHFMQKRLVEENQIRNEIAIIKNSYRLQV